MALLRREKRIQNLREKFESAGPSSQSAKPCRLIALPREIHLQLLQHLRPAGQLSLGLTCKDLWRAVHSENTGELKVILSGDDRYEFLCLLSNELPEFLACYGCKVLHKRRVDEFCYIRSGQLYKLCDNTRAAFPAPCLEYALSYEMLDLVLRFEELSSDCGIPITLLSHQCKLHNFHAGELPCRIEVLPRICEGRLLLRIDSSIEIDHSQPLAEQVGRLPCLPCVHMATPMFMLHCVVTLQIGIMKPSSANSWSAMDRCAFCATDASSRLVFSDDGLVVKALLVRTWKDFGCRGGNSKQPWTGHVAAIAPPTKAIYLSGAKHLGDVFDGEEYTGAVYDNKMILNTIEGM